MSRETFYVVNLNLRSICSYSHWVFEEDFKSTLLCHGPCILYDLFNKKRQLWIKGSRTAKEKCVRRHFQGFEFKCAGVRGFKD